MFKAKFTGGIGALYGNMTYYVNCRPDEFLTDSPQYTNWALRRSSAYSHCVPSPKTIFGCIFAIVFSLGLLNVAADLLKDHLSTTSPTTTNTLAYTDHGRRYYISPRIAEWNTRLLIAYYIAFACAIVCALVLMHGERRAAKAVAHKTPRLPTKPAR